MLCSSGRAVAHAQQEIIAVFIIGHNSVSEEPELRTAWLAKRELQGVLCS